MLLTETDHRAGQVPRPAPQDARSSGRCGTSTSRSSAARPSGIIGHNGAGKSTLLKILSRITPPTEGEARLRGRVGALLEVGTGFHPELTGRENVFLNGAILNMKRQEIQRRFDEIVEFADIGPFIDTPVKRYSSGMQLRLAFSVAAHLEPEILIIDEVLSVGDLAFQQKCLGRMEAASREGRTVVFISHSLAVGASASATARSCSRRAGWPPPARSGRWSTPTSATSPPTSSAESGTARTATATASFASSTSASSGTAR